MLRFEDHRDMSVIQWNVQRGHSLSIPFSAIVGLASFLVINIPSIKLFLGPQPIVNVVALTLLLGFAAIRVLHSGRPSVTQSGLIVLFGLVSVLMLSLLASLFEDRMVISDFLDAILGFTYIIFTTSAVLITAVEWDVKAYLWFQAGWGFLIAMLYRIGYIHANLELSQHYNTVTLPITLSMLILAVSWLVPRPRKQQSFYKWPLIASALVIESLTLLSLPGRSPWIGIPLIVFFVMVFPVSRKFSLRKYVDEWIRAMVTFAVLGCLIVGAVRTFNVSIHPYLLYRIEHFKTYGIADEPRIPFTVLTIQRIRDNPLGYGLGSYPRIIGENYPHNIILDALFSGGWLAGLILVVCLGLTFRKLLDTCRYCHNSNRLGMFMVSSYLLFTFLNSYSLSDDSHLLFTCLALGTATRVRVSGAGGKRICTT
jgi:hypothetical protein